MSKKLEDYLGSIIEDIKQSKNLSPPLRSKKEVIEYLDKICEE